MTTNRLLLHQSIHAGESLSTPLPNPQEPAYVDRTAAYRAVHFFGSQLHVPMRDAADYLQALERAWGAPPHVLCSHAEFSAQDARGDLAWKVTVVIDVDHGTSPST